MDFDNVLHPMIDSILGQVVYLGPHFVLLVTILAKEFFVVLEWLDAPLGPTQHKI